MSTQQMPNPVDLYQAAAQNTKKIIAGTRADQLSDSTPCSEWNVQALIDHLAGGTGFAISAMSGVPPTELEPGSGSVELYDQGTAKVLDVARTPGTLEKTVQTPIGEMPGSHFMMAVFMDALIHGWDLAKATGQDTKLDPNLVEACYAVFGPQADNMRHGGAFGPEVVVSADADTQTKLLGALGRQA